MYHCHTSFYYTGRRREGLAFLRALTPFAAFTHTFAESDVPEQAPAQPADVIFADVRETDACATVRTLAGWKKPAAELIVLADAAAAAALTDAAGALLPEDTDIWLVPMTDAEWRFRLQRWQRAY